MPTPKPEVPRRRGLRSRAFTLIELLVTLVIIAALLAVAMVSYTSVIGHSRDRATAIQLTQLYKDAAGTAAMRQEPVTLTDFQNAATEIPVQAAGAAAGRATNLAAGRWQVLDSTTPITGMGQVQVTTITTETGRIVTGLAARSRPGHCVLLRGELMATVTTSVDGSCTETAAGAATTLSTSTGKLTASAPAQLLAPTVTAGNASLAVSWQAALADGGAALTGYKVTLTPASGAPVVKTVTADVTTVTVTGLANGTSYSVTVAATNIVGTGTPSPAVSATPATAPSTLTAPTVKAGDAQVDVTWTAPASDGGSAVTSYKVVLTPASGAVVEKVVAVPALTVKVSGLLNNVTYSVTVAATNSIGRGAPSPAATVTPSSPLLEVTDNFQRPNSATLGKTPSGLVWQDPWGDYGIFSNQARVTSSSPDRPIPVWVDIKSANQQVSVTGSQYGTSVILRATDKNNYIYVLRQSGTSYGVYDYVNGWTYQRCSGSATWTTAKVTGTTVTLLNGTNAIANCPTTVISGTGAGFGATNYGATTWTFTAKALP